MQYREILEARVVKEPPVELPPKAEAAIGKLKRVPLKDGRTAEISLSKDHIGFALHVTIDGEGFFVGSLHLSPNRLPPRTDLDGWDQYAEDRGSWSATNAYVDPNFQRLGIATAMYDYATRLGFKILPSGHHGGKLSSQGAALWQSRQKPWRLNKPRPKQNRFWKPKT
jgi:GNAT superfamily N-acetyltransferase